MTIPDDIKRTADAVLKYLYENDILEQGGECSSWCGNGCGCSKVEEGIKEAISQALLSSRDQGYQEGVEDAVKAVEKAATASISSNGIDYELISRPEAISRLASLKDELKPKEKV